MGSENSVVMVLASRDFQDIEYNETYEALKAASIDVKIVSGSSGECKGVMGTSVCADFSFDEIDPAQYDAVVLIGGTGVEQYLHDADLHSLVKSFVALDKLVAAICWAPAILANAGVLQGKQATAWSGAKGDLDRGGATYTGAPVTIDGNLITANGPDVAMKFGMAVAKAVVG